MSDQFTLSPEHSSLISRFVASGRFEGPQAVIGAALSLLEGRERDRTEKLSALHEALAEETFREIEHLMATAFSTPALRKAS